MYLCDGYVDGKRSGKGPGSEMATSEDDGRSEREKSGKHRGRGTGIINPAHDLHRSGGMNRGSMTDLEHRRKPGTHDAHDGSHSDSSRSSSRGKKKDRKGKHHSGNKKHGGGDRSRSGSHSRHGDSKSKNRDHSLSKGRGNHDRREKYRRD
ncbi:unnamed protein product [Didymodactylos carnosus]|uniref:Uncharacterized protein n=1 Tax=Didymodactylos carnosus TaxID=1234261 RepID=A0A813R6Y6_9BILA|nr:unnamed protein product [Didymodactylos carnosus]CAF0814264.1 unnamed protein product [Didymodactylos carnosus]CAF3558677.1 unnamed protein product [Didymodactylos carnosus]CAF3598207.1 unnamed protein product [Didymodactylos carnosus]